MGKDYLDYEGLKKYDELIKKYIDAGDEESVETIIPIPDEEIEEIIEGRYKEEEVNPDDLITPEEKIPEDENTEK
jgi:hypothetical protein